MPTRLRRFAQSPRSPIVRERPTMHGTPVCAPLRPGSPTLPATSLTFSATSRDPRLCFPCDPDERQLRHDEQRLRRDAYEVGARAHLQPGRGPVGRRAAYLRARSSKRRSRCRAHYAPCRRIRRRVPVASVDERPSPPSTSKYRFLRSLLSSTPRSSSPTSRGIFVDFDEELRRPRRRPRVSSPTPWTPSPRPPATFLNAGDATRDLGDVRSDTTRRVGSDRSWRSGVSVHAGGSEVSQLLI